MPMTAKACRLTQEARADYETAFNDPALAGSIQWHMAGRALLAAGLLDPDSMLSRSMKVMTRDSVRPTSRAAKAARE